MLTSPRTPFQPSNPITHRTRHSWNHQQRVHDNCSVQNYLVAQAKTVRDLMRGVQRSARILEMAKTANQLDRSHRTQECMAYLSGIVHLCPDLHFDANTPCCVLIIFDCIWYDYGTIDERTHCVPVMLVHKVVGA